MLTSAARGIAMALTMSLAAACGAGGGATPATPSTPPGSTTGMATASASAAPPVCDRAFGVYTDRPDLASVDADLDTHVTIVHEFWTLAGPTLQFLSTIRARGSVPMLNIDPEDTPDPLHAILSGAADDRLVAWGRVLAAYEAPLFIDPLAEMDLNSHAYGIGDHATPQGVHYTNTGADIIAAYRRIHDVIVAAGGTRVQWVFNPVGVKLTNSPTDWEHYYPGAAYVDWVALDPYNFAADGLPPATWDSLRLLLQRGGNPPDPGPYARMTRLAPGKPMMLAEFGSVEHGGDKGQWMRNAGRDLANDRLFPALRAAVYFDGSTGPVDLHLATTPGSLAGARDGFGKGSPYCMTADQLMALAAPA